ncbi:MAG TPA: hypothetical protein VGJ32_12580 [Solirubrobacteraceae bacterium]
MAVTLAVTEEPERAAARVAVGGIPAGAATLTVERTSPSGAVAGVRGAVGASASGLASYVTRDYELPLGVALTYAVTVYDGASAVVGQASAAFELTYPDLGDPWLVDLARPLNSLPVLVESLAELSYEAATGVHRVLERRAPVLTALPGWTPAAELVVVTATEEERERARALLGTGYPLLLRTPPAQGVGNIFLGVTGFVEARASRLAQAQDRRFRISCTQVERPDPSIYVPLAPSTYAGAKATYATYADLLAGAATYEGLAYTYPSGVADPILPWLPDDV